jgi:hypothetical protein
MSSRDYGALHPGMEKGLFKGLFRQWWIFFFYTTSELTTGGFLMVYCIVNLKSYQ